MERNRENIEEAKRRLPLPALMAQLGFGVHAKQSACCPFHEDGSPSFSLFQNADGSHGWKCHAGCGKGDEIDFLAKAKGYANGSAVREFLMLAGVTNCAPPSRCANLDWAKCVSDFTESDSQKLAAWRGLSIEFVRWLHEQAAIGMHEGNFAFPNHDADGKVVSAHARLPNGKWIFKPKGQATAPLIFGDLKNASVVLAFESQWDAFAIMSKLGWHAANDLADTAVFITRGAGNAKLIRGRLSSSQIVYAFKQNDLSTDKKPVPAADTWLAELAEPAGCRVLNVATPAPHADANDWTRAGATKADIEAAIKAAKPVQAQAARVAVSGKHETPQATRTDSASNHFKNDVGYGDAFVERYSKTIRYVADEKIWLTFDDENGWRRDNRGQIKSMAAAYARELYRDAVQRAVNLEPDEGKRLVASVAALGNRKRIDPALAFAECNAAIVVSSEQLDADPFLVGVENGVVNLRDGTFQPHRSEHLVTRRLAVKFQANATAPTWEKFLAEVQPDVEMRNFLQRLSGYSITGETRDHVLPFHFGIGANGKGTFLEQSLLKMMGSYGAKLTNSLVYASDRGQLPHLELANLCGRRFALGEENSEGGNLNERLLKAITGGDKVKGRFHYGNFVEYFPTYKIALVGNHKPRISGTDDGIWRRFLLVDWPLQIPKDKRDATLKDKLAAEMPGILNWCIAGAQAWLTEGLNPPQSCTAATAEFRQKSDLLVEFISENFEQDPDSYCTKSETFKVYQRWEDRQGVSRSEKLSKRALGMQLVNRGWSEGKGGQANQHCWYGWRLIPT